MMTLNENIILLLKSLRTGFSSGGSEIIITNGINVSVREGELVAIIGKNGSGKSTLLRTIAGLQAPLSGKIFHKGKELQDHSRMDLARKVSYISTEQVRVSNMNVYDLVSIGRYPYTNWAGKIDSENHDIILEAIERSGMTHMITRMVGELSDGERQRAMIARVIAQNTELMVMDEPTAFLDIGSKFEILHLLHGLTRYNGRSVVFSTHDLHLAMDHADKIWLLKDSGIVEGAPEDMMLQGEFEHIFDSAAVKYNAEHGTFIFSGSPKKYVYLAGEGVMRGWTEKALTRSGFGLSEDKSMTYIDVPSGDNKCWNVVSSNVEYQFSSLYDLIRFMNTIV